ncbi:Mu transposase C-terminal domain-containing protein [Fictibacillus norfolkensis]|uniref:Mu transposase C-terminal domain-containing protein n=1 Tax=Fictibacillus norfolkensis TaxID=2762233 RepID=A0ABR8SR25_9BACL|nr:Mu transposase C-terminal domain-containing protein [Fictibacillus norfolkensis]MBD7965945.1 Mu transposase C-terminal domain-containing protein [Fictibacillus norfolkensis]
MIIYQNSIIELLDSDLKTEKIIRVLWISPNQEDIYVVDISDYKKMTFPFPLKYTELLTDLEDDRAQVVQVDPDLRLVSPDPAYLEKYKKDRDNNWNIIKDIVCQEPEIYISIYRGTLVEETKEKTGKSKKEIYKFLKKYWFYGKTINALLKNYFECGRSFKPRNYTKKPGPKSKDGNEWIVTEKDKEIFRKAIKKFHTKEKMDLTATHQHMCEEWYKSGFYREHGVMVPIVDFRNAPSLRQFTYWYKKEISPMQRYSNRRGKRKAEMDVRPIQGNPTARAIGIGHLYEIDSTPADIILVAEDRETIIGTPTLYIVKDVYSRMITGFHASLSPASRIELMVAMINAASEKVEFCRQYGIEIKEHDWPCKNLPVFLSGDRGELKSKWAENLVNLKVDVDNAPSYRGDLKPFVEQHFRIINKEIRELFYKAGAKPPKMIERGDEDPTGKAALTIYEFTQFMILQILTYNKSALPEEFLVTKEMFEEKVELSPKGIWEWGESKSALHEEQQDVLIYNLLPKEQSTVTRRGIKFSNMYYTSDLGLKYGWFVDEKIDQKKEIEIRYDPRNVSCIFIRMNNGKIEKCFLTEKYKEYDGLHLEDVKAIMQYKKDEIRNKESEEKQHKAVLHAYSKNLANEAIRKTKEATEFLSLAQRKKDRRDTKKSESRFVGSHNAFTAKKLLDTNNEKIETAEVITFPNKIENDATKIQKLFGAMNKERRSGRESLE